MVEKKNSNSPLYLTLKKVLQKNIGRDLSNITRENLRILVQGLNNYVKDYKVLGTVDSDNKLVEIINNLSKSYYVNQLTREKLLELYLAFISYPSNIHSLAMRDKDLEAAWKFILTNGDFTLNDIKMVSGKKIEYVVASYWSASYRFEPAFGPLKVSGYASNYGIGVTNLIFSLPIHDRINMLKWFYGEDILNPKILENLPEDKSFVVENFEPSIGTDLAYLKGLAMTGNLEFERVLSASQLNKLKKLFKTKEYLPGLSKNSLDRIELLANAYSLYWRMWKGKLNKYADNPAYFAKYLISDFPKEIYSSRFQIFLPEYKGFTKSWAENSNVRAMTEIVPGLLKGAEKGWMSLENLKLRYLCSSSSKIDIFYVQLFGHDSKQRNGLKRKDETVTVSFEPKDWLDEINFPFILNWIKFLCGAGLLEIARLEKEELKKDDPLEGMRFVRLTQLGRYAFGFDKEYILPPVDTSGMLEIDDKNKIIRVLSDNCPYTMFLQQVSEQIGPTRYHLNADSFLANCESVERANGRIDTLKTLVNLHDYPGFKELIADVAKRLNFAEYQKEDFMVYKLREDLPGLQKMLMNDKEIRENVILAERGHFLFRRSFLERFKTLCSRHGYILY